ncbi:hypothetical protein X777_14268 [Ooceraea biroi]|uniref:Uncharacterized protein n=1 Tax=Ooceraea biroi TaxID=2015173 RepID=A0A026WXC0_OOCBI|nr:hypothetical protein X777_14268 [Ooceraea biroi]
MSPFDRCIDLQIDHFEQVNKLILRFCLITFIIEGSQGKLAEFICKAHSSRDQRVIQLVIVGVIIDKLTAIILGKPGY